MNDHEKYFYASDDEAATYDLTVELTQPLFGIIHSTVTDLLKLHFDSPHVQAAGRNSVRILDIGALRRSGYFLLQIVA